MTHTELLLVAATVSGFALLLLTLGSFFASRQALGLVLLVAAAAAFVAALVLVGQVSHAQEVARRHAVLAKYDVTVQQWGAPLGSSPMWRVDKADTHCDVDLDDESDPVVTCDGHELPLR